jgi:putative acetyltransferase
MITIIDFDEKYAADFKRLNLQWLEQYNLLESHDLFFLNDPVETIIKKRGCIYLAKEEDTIVGSAALIMEHEGLYELAKMAVQPSHQGKGISKLLLQRCIDKAREWKAVRLSLFSNHQLVNALKLYQQFGFKQVAVEDSPFATADVKMELTL